MEEGWGDSVTMVGWKGWCVVSLVSLLQNT